METINTTIQYPQVNVHALGHDGVMIYANMYEAFAASNEAAIEFDIAPEHISIEMVWLH